MSFELDTAIAGIGFISFLIGVLLWLGLPAALIVFGLVMMFVGWRMNTAVTRPEPQTQPPSERKS